MSFYHNSTPNALFSAVEFSEQAEGNTAFFYAAPSQAVNLRAYLDGLGQKIVAQTTSQEQAVFVTHGSKTQGELMQAFAGNGAILTEQATKAAFQPWKWRGNLNFAGQGLTLLSGYFKQGGLDAAKLTFALTNILASVINVTLGAQKSDDVNRLHVVEQQFSAKLAPYLSKQAQQKNEQLVEQPAKPKDKSIGGFLVRNSVRFGEIGLRYFASVALTFPLASWGKAAAALKNGPAAALRIARNPDNNGFHAGLIYLVGKTLGFFAKVADPYSDKPHTALDTIREKVLFRLSSVIETGAALKLAHGSFTHGNITVAGKKYTDIPGGVGGLFLAGGLTTRYFAPFGVRKTDMHALENFLVQALAQLPPEKLPQLLAETAAQVKDHFKEDAPPLGQIYADLVKGVHEHHLAHDTEYQTAKPNTAGKIIPSNISAQPISSHLERLTKEVQISARGF